MEAVEAMPTTLRQWRNVIQLVCQCQEVSHFTQQYFIGRRHIIVFLNDSQLWCCGVCPLFWGECLVWFICFNTSIRLVNTGETLQKQQDFQCLAHKNPNICVCIFDCITLDLYKYKTQAWNTIITECHTAAPRDCHLPCN